MRLAVNGKLLLDLDKKGRLYSLEFPSICVKRFAIDGGKQAK